MAGRKSVPEHWVNIHDSDAIGKSIARMSYEILEANEDIDSLAIVGIKTGGEYIARRIHKRIEEIENRKVAFGVIDITLYRDDLSHSNEQPTLKGTDLPFRISQSRIVLVDDVLYTGRTVRAALDAITDFGRPACVELAVLADRGHRELPIRADFVGKNIPTNKEDFVRLRMEEMGFDDGLYLIRGEHAESE